jgi:F0F1-type ATP synthase epsilon subunit
MTAETNEEKLKNSVNVLTEQAEVAATLAREQRRTADQQSETARNQHVTAAKLEDLSVGLANGATDLKKNLAGKLE